MNSLKSCTRLGSLVMCGLMVMSVSAHACWPFSKSRDDAAMCKVNFEQAQKNLNQSRDEFRGQCENVIVAADKLENYLNDLKAFKKISQELSEELQDTYTEWSNTDYRIDTPVYSKYIAAKVKLKEEEDILSGKRATIKESIDGLLSLIKNDPGVTENYRNSLNSSVEAYYKYVLAVTQEAVN